jgi:hypothetical protein
VLEHWVKIHQIGVDIAGMRFHGSFRARGYFTLGSLAGGRPGALKIIEWYPRGPFLYVLSYTG